MNPLVFLRLQAFLVRLAINSNQSKTSDPLIRESSELTPLDTRLDIYQHRA